MKFWLGEIPSRNGMAWDKACKFIRLQLVWEHGYFAILQNNPMSIIGFLSAIPDGFDCKSIMISNWSVSFYVNVQDRQFGNMRTWFYAMPLNYEIDGPTKIFIMKIFVIYFLLSLHCYLECEIFWLQTNLLSADLIMATAAPATTVSTDEIATVAPAPAGPSPTIKSVLTYETGEEHGQVTSRMKFFLRQLLNIHKV